jgi:hypothetical protein
MATSALTNRSRIKRSTLGGIVDHGAAPTLMSTRNLRKRYLPDMYRELKLVHSEHVPKTYFRTWFLINAIFCLCHLVLGLYFAVRISAASESLPDLTLVVRREWTRRLAPPAREWTERIGMLRFEEEGSRLSRLRGLFHCWTTSCRNQR